MTDAERIVRRILSTVTDPVAEAAAWAAARDRSTHTLTFPPFVLYLYRDRSVLILDRATPPQLWGWEIEPLGDPSLTGVIAWLLGSERAQVREAVLARLSEILAAAPDPEVG